MTGFGDPDVHARAKALGAALVLDKPFPMERLRAAVTGLLPKSPSS
jgi:DNA-binding response OmpR family regulator